VPADTALAVQSNFVSHSWHVSIFELLSVTSPVISETNVLTGQLRKMYLWNGRALPHGAGAGPRRLRVRHLVLDLLRRAHLPQLRHVLQPAARGRRLQPLAGELLETKPPYTRLLPHCNKCNNPPMHHCFLKARYVPLSPTCNSRVAPPTTGSGVVENKHSKDVESSPPPPRVSMRAHCEQALDRR